MATKVVKHWAKKTRALAWGRWWGEVRHNREAKALKWMQKTICAACRVWRTRVKELRRQQGVLEKMTLWMKNMHYMYAKAFRRLHEVDTTNTQNTANSM